MKRRLDIIHVRPLARCSKSLMEVIRKSAVAKSNRIQMKIYQQEGVATDVGIHLHYMVKEDDALPSDLGVLLASALREHGMVEHSVWNEEKEENR